MDAIANRLTLTNASPDSLRKSEPMPRPLRELSGPRILHSALACFCRRRRHVGHGDECRALAGTGAGQQPVGVGRVIGLILLYLARRRLAGRQVGRSLSAASNAGKRHDGGSAGIGADPNREYAGAALGRIGMGDFAVGLLAAALLAVVLLFSIPGILMGVVTPWAVRLALQDVEHAGQIGGRLYAIGTAGSIVGAFLPTLVLIPTFGTRWTFYLLAPSAGGHHAKPLAQAHNPSAARTPDRHPATGRLTHPSQSIRCGWDDGRCRQDPL